MISPTVYFVSTFGRQCRTLLFQTVGLQPKTQSSPYRVSFVFFICKRRRAPRFVLLIGVFLLEVDSFDTVFCLSAANELAREIVKVRVRGEGCVIFKLPISVWTCYVIGRTASRRSPTARNVGCRATSYRSTRALSAASTNKVYSQSHVTPLVMQASCSSLFLILSVLCLYLLLLLCSPARRLFKPLLRRIDLRTVNLSTGSPSDRSKH